MLSEHVHLVECPRDAMQGLRDFIPTQLKIDYLNALLQAGFDTLDFGSFVSPKAIPQLADTAKVVDALEMDNISTKLLAIIANERGANDALNFEKINYLGFPFSVSETFQERNTRATREEAFKRVENIQNLCLQKGKEMVVYISMGFGNPYGDKWNVEVVENWVKKLADIDIKTIALADTIGIAEPESIDYLYSNLIPEYPSISFGAHFHSRPETWMEKIDAALKAGCRRFDSSIKGIGGCPMAKDELVGNIDTLKLYPHLIKEGFHTHVDVPALQASLPFASSVFF